MQQVTLSTEQIAGFYHEDFFLGQVDSVIDLAGPRLVPGSCVVADIGGGCGFFAKLLEHRTGVKTRVLDTDPISVRRCREAGIDAELSDALKPIIRGDETLACFNMILHHLVGVDEKSTKALQAQALKAWRDIGTTLFVNEYIYESYCVDGLAGSLIYRVTSSRFLSLVGRIVSKLIPSLRANTFGVGVRFRSRAEWVALFEALGFKVIGYIRGDEEDVSLARRILFIKSCRKDSFLLS